MGPVQILEITSPEEIRREMAVIGCDPTGVAVMIPKAIHRLVRITGVPAKAANLLKQEMLAKGGDCAVHRLVCVLGVETSTVLLMGTERQFRALTAKLKSQPFGLKAIGEAVEKAWDRYEG
ncbi:MAG: dihydropteroate synthase, partial [Heliobacteriaceae bacterium]|nr:dihydropteroate synthase [Heliobacteriaceae bacterium]